jgi:hypothetical protein
MKFDIFIRTHNVRINSRLAISSMIHPSGISGAHVITIFDNNAINLSSNSDNGFRVFGPPPVPTVSS